MALLQWTLDKECCFEVVYLNVGCGFMNLNDFYQYYYYYYLIIIIFSSFFF